MAKFTKQPDKFFLEATAASETLQGIPIVAIERMKTDRGARDFLIDILRWCLKVFREIKVDPVTEILEQETRQSAIKKLLSEDKLVSLGDLDDNGLTLKMTDEGPIVVPKNG